jgi:SAM-dependent methyltransferase
MPALAAAPPVDPLPQQAPQSGRPIDVRAWIADAGFAHPRGLMGWMGGLILAAKNRERQRWLVSRLDLRPTDRVLEVGPGPGVGIAEAARTAAYVGGVDPSDVMMRMARKRNSAAIAAGRVELRPGGAQAIPFADREFDKAFAGNSVKMWPDPIAGLREIQRVLRPGGLVAISWQPVPGEARDEPALERLGAWLAGLLRESGYDDIRIERRSTGKGASTICALGTAPRQGSG